MYSIGLTISLWPNMQAQKIIQTLVRDASLLYFQIQTYSHNL